MDTKLDTLIEKLKTEGVEAARQQSDDIIDKAKKEAEQIIKKAKTDADSLVKQAETKALEFKGNSEAAIHQASRDMVLVLEEKIIKLFNKTLKAKVENSLSDELIKSLISKIAEQIKPEGIVGIQINDSEKSNLMKVLQSGLKDTLKNEFEIKVSNRINKGFRIGIKDEDVYYDFTDESITSSLLEFLNPTLQKLVKSE
jgi:V/A-type H+-transporting ATPase subunit E